MHNGFWHVLLDDTSSRLTTFATPFSRYRWLRMPFRIVPASEIFQRSLEQQLEGLGRIKNIHDDILVWGEGNGDAEAELNHDGRMHALLKRCQERNIKLNSSEKKFVFQKRSLPYMGRVFNHGKLSPEPQKLEAITRMSEPNDQASLRRFLGMVNYISRFVPHLSDLCPIT